MKLYTGYEIVDGEIRPLVFDIDPGQLASYLAAIISQKTRGGLDMTYSSIMRLTNLLLLEIEEANQRMENTLAHLAAQSK